MWLRAVQGVRDFRYSTYYSQVFKRRHNVKSCDRAIMHDKEVPGGVPGAAAAHPQAERVQEVFEDEGVRNHNIARYEEIQILGVVAEGSNEGRSEDQF